MAVTGIDVLFGAAPTTDRPPVTARVVRSGGDGVFAVPIGGDTRYPVGPCRGPKHMAVGEVVLLIFTQEQPWILAGDFVTQHELDTTNVHGIADTALLETTTGAQAKATAAGTQAANASIPRALLAAAGDLVAAAALGTPARVPLGSTGQVLTVDGGAPAWRTPAVKGVPKAVLEEHGDLIAASTSETAVRVPVGEPGQYLTPAPATEPGLAWVDLPAQPVRDTGVRRVVSAGAVADLPGMRVWVHRVHGTVTVTVSETAAGTVPAAVLTTLPGGFRPPPFGPGPITAAWDATTGAEAGRLQVSPAGLVGVTGLAVDGVHSASLTYLTRDTWPAALPGVAE